MDWHKLQPGFENVHSYKSAEPGVKKSIVFARKVGNKNDIQNG